MNIGSEKRCPMRPMRPMRIMRIMQTKNLQTKNLQTRNRKVRRQCAAPYAPFLSVFIIVVALFAVVFCKMEMRRMGYSVLKLTREERKMRDQERQQMIELAKATRLDRLRSVAESRLTLKQAQAGQIVQMTEGGIVLRH